MAGPELQGTERAVCRGERKSDRRAQREHWLGRVAAGIQSGFRGKSCAQSDNSLHSSSPDLSRSVAERRWRDQPSLREPSSSNPLYNKTLRASGFTLEANTEVPVCSILNRILFSLEEFSLQFKLHYIKKKKGGGTNSMLTLWVHCSMV